MHHGRWQRARRILGPHRLLALCLAPARGRQDHWRRARRRLREHHPHRPTSCKSLRLLQHLPHRPTRLSSCKNRRRRRPCLLVGCYFRRRPRARRAQTVDRRRRDLGLPTMDPPLYRIDHLLILPSKRCSRRKVKLFSVPEGHVVPEFQDQVWIVGRQRPPRAKVIHFSRGLSFRRAAHHPHTSHLEPWQRKHSRDLDRSQMRMASIILR